EDVEALQAEQERRALGEPDAILDEDGNVLSPRASERGLTDDLSVDDRAVVVRAVAVIVNAGRCVERAGGGERRDGARREASREAVEERQNGAVALVNHARAALVLAEPQDVRVVRPRAVAVR